MHEDGRRGVRGDQADWECAGEREELPGGCCGIKGGRLPKSICRRRRPGMILAPEG